MTRVMFEGVIVYPNQISCARIKKLLRSYMDETGSYIVTDNQPSAVFVDTAIVFHDGYYDGFDDLVPELFYNGEGWLLWHTPALQLVGFILDGREMEGTDYYSYIKYVINTGKVPKVPPSLRPIWQRYRSSRTELYQLIGRYHNDPFPNFEFIDHYCKVYSVDRNAVIRRWIESIVCHSRCFFRHKYRREIKPTMSIFRKGVRLLDALLLNKGVTLLDALKSQSSGN